MISALLRFVLNQRLIVVALGIALVGAGLYAFGKLKIEAYPDISDTQAVVISLYPGHAASFTTFYGAGANQTHAMDTLTRIGAQVYALDVSSAPPIVIAGRTR